MTYLFISPNDEYPRYVGDIYREYPEFDGVSLPSGWKEVLDSPAPFLEENETLVEDFPILVDGKYVRSLSKRALTLQEIEDNARLLEEQE
jgi:hypothetical protein